MNWGYLILLLFLALGMAVFINWVRKLFEGIPLSIVLINIVVTPVVWIKSLPKKIKRWFVCVPSKWFMIGVGYFRMGLKWIIIRLDKFIDWYHQIFIEWDEEKEEE